MKIITDVSEAVNSKILKPGSKIYTSGNAAVPQILLKQLAKDKDIIDVDLFGLLLLGDIPELFSEETCKRITHRVGFSGGLSRNALNQGWAKYQLMHLSDVPRQVREYLRPNVMMVTVSGPDTGGNYSLGTTVEGVFAGVEHVKESGGIVIAEKNKKMPFILGTTIHESQIDYLIESDYPLPVSPVKTPDELSSRIGEIIAKLYIDDGCTLQYGIGEVPDAVTDAILNKGVKNLSIYTELFADAMRTLVEKGVVNNYHRKHNFSVASIFLSGSQEGYNWLGNNSSVQSRPSNTTNNIINIASQPKMISINSAIGVDLHGNIWADSLQARKIYSGIGGQADFIRGAYLSEGGIPIIALKSSTLKGMSKIMNKCPEGITTTAIAADPVVIVTEHGAFDPRGLSMGEHAVGIAHLAEPNTREKLLKEIYENKAFHNPQTALKNGKVKGFTSYKDIN